jgi:hypothetical protein
MDSFHVARPWAETLKVSDVARIEVERLGKE